MSATTSRTAESPRTDHILDLCGALRHVDDPADANRLVDALAPVLTDAVLSADGAAVEAAAFELRAAAAACDGEPALAWAELRGRLDGLGDLLRGVLEHRNAEASAAAVEPGSHAHRMLALLDDAGNEAFNSGGIASALRVDKTQVSRTGRDLIERGLAATSSLGRNTFWEITPRGQYALEQLGQPVDPSQVEGTLALTLGDVTDEAAELAAAAVAGRHRDVSVFVISPRAVEPAVVRGRRGAVPVVLVHAPRRRQAGMEELEHELASESPTGASRLAVVPQDGAARAMTVLTQSAADARGARRGRKARTSTRPAAPVAEPKR